MSLTKEDLVQIREIVSDVVDRKIDSAIAPLQGELEAIRSDLRYIYDKLADLEKKIGQKSILDPAFLELPEKEQLLRLNDVVLAMAKRLDVTLPR